ncbi:MAG: SGNH/GDSL hydrolase family protein [Massilia sp.]
MALIFGLSEWQQYQQQFAGAPIILCFGDSWFQYPFPASGNLCNRFLAYGHQVVDIVSIGELGMEIGKPGKSNLSHLLTFMQWESKQVDMLIISGGGNDFAGADDLRPLLKHGVANDISSWFKAGETAALFGLIKRGYENIVHLRDQLCPDIPILTHCYDYPEVNGKGLLWFSPWIQPALIDVGMPAALHQEAGRYIIDRLADVQLALAGKHPHYEFIDTRHTLAKADWANELHPNNAGFDKMAAKFYPSLKQHFPEWIS